MVRRIISIGMIFLCLPSIAEAQDARSLFNEGVRLMSESKLDEACPKFEASLKQFPGIGTRGKLAECYEKQGRFVSAWNAYREVAQLAARNGDVAREQVASERAKSLESKLSYLTVNVPTASDPPGLVVKRNGKELDRAKFGIADPVDAGDVTLEISAPGRKPTTARLTLMFGQSARYDVPVLDLDLVPTTTTPEKPAEPSRGGSGWQRPTGLVLAGVGIVGVAAGSIFGLTAKSGYDGAFDRGHCDHTTNQCDAEGQSSIDDARTKATVSTICFAAGGALLVGGAVLFLLAPSKSSSKALRVAPTTYAGGAGLVLGGSL